MPLLTIIIPVYNAEKTVGRALESLEAISRESRPLVEVVIVDDGSQDGSMDIVESKKEDLLPLNIVVVKQDNLGVAAARNGGLRHCNGKWIFFLDADDEMTFDPISHIRDSPDSSALGFSVRFYRDLKPHSVYRPVLINQDNHLDVFTATNAFTVSSIIFKRNHVRSFFNDSFRYLEDWLFWITNPSIFEKMKIFTRVTSANIHSHGENRTSNYVMTGKYREKIANEVLVKLGNILTRKQKNNLFIQSKIGLIQQGGKIGLKTFLSFPCDIKLFLKLIVFFLLRSNFAKFDLYGQKNIM